MDALEIVALLDEAAGECESSHLNLAKQLYECMDASAPVLPRPGDLGTIGRYTNDQAEQLGRAVRIALGYDVQDVVDDLPRRLDKAFGVRASPIDCNYAAGGTLATQRHRLIFCSRSADDPQFELALECGRIFISLANWRRDVATLTLVGAARLPRKHYFARRFAAELLVSDELLAGTLHQARHELGVRSKTIGDIEIVYISRLLRLSFLNTAKRLEQSRYLPGGGAESLDRYLETNHGGAEQRALDIGFPPRPPDSFLFTVENT